MRESNNRYILIHTTSHENISKKFSNIIKNPTFLPKKNQNPNLIQSSLKLK